MTNKNFIPLAEREDVPAEKRLTELAITVKAFLYGLDRGYFGLDVPSTAFVEALRMQVTPIPQPKED
jgi:hypothetical protein